MKFLKPQKSIMTAFYLVFAAKLALVLGTGLIASAVIQHRVEVKLKQNYIVQQSTTAELTAQELKSRVDALKDKLTYISQIDRINSLNADDCNAELDKLVSTIG